MKENHEFMKKHELMKEMTNIVKQMVREEYISDPNAANTASYAGALYVTLKDGISMQDVMNLPQDKQRKFIELTEKYNTDVKVLAGKKTIDLVDLDREGRK